ncbi:unnamed protein product [Arabidopsis halleri]
MIANEFENMDKERLRKRPRMTWDEAMEAMGGFCHHH